MGNSNNIINEIYDFLSESNLIPRSVTTNKKEGELLKKLEYLHNSNILSDTDYDELHALFCSAIFENELNGFVSGIYLSEKLKSEFNKNYIL